MSERTSFLPGTPSWVDLGTPDLDGSAAFYSSLFGWTAWRAPQEEAGGYTMFEQDGKPVAGMGPLMMEGQPSAWMTYVTVEDADKTVAVATEAGATVFVPPMDVLDVGRMAIFADPSGAVISIWQPRAHQGAAIVNEPVSLGWNELATRDVEGAKAFYGAVFGWTGNTATVDAMTYTEWQLDGDTIGGMMEMGDNFPPETPPHWLAYFVVADTDATTAKASELGGTVIAPPMDIMPGRMAVVADPHGAVFAVIALSQPGR